MKSFKALFQKLTDLVCIRDYFLQADRKHEDSSIICAVPHMHVHSCRYFFLVHVQLQHFKVFCSIDIFNPIITGLEMSLAT